MFKCLESVCFPQVFCINRTVLIKQMRLEMMNGELRGESPLAAFHLLLDHCLAFALLEKGKDCF